MKKLFYGAALLAVAAGSFAFLPKEEEPAGYMMLSIDRTTLIKAVVRTITPSGSVTKLEIAYDRTSFTSFDIQLEVAEIQRLNELVQQGWRVRSTRVVSSELIYLLDRN